MAEQHVKWRLPEQWSVTRSDGATLRLDLTQDGDTLSGTAQAGAVAGIMSGSTTGDSVELTVYWPAGAVTEYRGSVDAGGTASGTAVEGSAASATIEWRADVEATRWA